MIDIALLAPFFLIAFVRSPLRDVTDKLWSDGGRLRCPKCGWQPQRHDRWSCDPGGCGHVWNTFDTGGTCPQCNRQWNETACLRCGQWSPHDDWFGAS